MDTPPPTHPLPPRYADWVDTWLDAPVGPEPRATCADCAMCPRDPARVTPGMGTFSPVTKCCTYVPSLPNFLVGEVLRDAAPDAAAGRATVEARIRARVAVTPLGLARSRRYDLLYTEGRAGFGRAESMRCPHHAEDGRCGIWRHRESTCFTWFCKYERGALGLLFWRRLHDLLLCVESALARHAVLEIGLPDKALTALFPPRGVPGAAELGAADLDERADAAAYAALWGEWIDREIEFYRAAAALVSALDARAVRLLGGPDFEIRLRLVQAAQARLCATDIPARVVPQPIAVVGTSDELARIVGYSALDPLQVPKTLLNVLHRFDGRPTTEVLAAIDAELGLRIAPAVVRKLVAFGVLGEAE